jgi:hypothetical protein
MTTENGLQGGTEMTVLTRPWRRVSPKRWALCDTWIMLLVINGLIKFGKA